jgi:hypothetical protein
MTIPDAFSMERFGLSMRNADAPCLYASSYIAAA